MSHGTSKKEGDPDSKAGGSSFLRKNSKLVANYTDAHPRI
jgi:hypothetical protein